MKIVLKRKQKMLQVSNTNENSSKTKAENAASLQVVGYSFIPLWIRVFFFFFLSKLAFL